MRSPAGRGPPTCLTGLLTCRPRSHLSLRTAIQGQVASQKCFAGSSRLLPSPNMTTILLLHTQHCGPCFPMANSDMNWRENGCSFSPPEGNQDFSTKLKVTPVIDLCPRAACHQHTAPS